MGMDSYLCETSKREFEEHNNNIPLDERKYDKDNKMLRYWRRPYGLHSYIACNFCAGDDNCTRIVLSKDNIEKIITRMEMCLNNGFGYESVSNPFGEGDCWNIQDLKYAIKLFKDVYKNYNDKKIIYYYSCY